MKEKVCILLATYNGEKYLKKQLDSLINQTYENVHILIRDDGSTDSTVDIIKQYKADYPDKISVQDTTKNLGYPDCFWRLLVEAPEADYYAFSDQDDIWYPDKISRAVMMMCEAMTEEPKLYYHSYDICDGADNITDTYYPGNIDKIDIVKHFFYTYTMGFTMVINNAMRDLILSVEPGGKELPHDVWCILNAYYFGKICYDKTPQAAYRRHSSTVTSAGKGCFSLIKSWLKKEILGDAMDKLRHRISLFYEFNKTALVDVDICKYQFLFTKGGINYYINRLFYPNRLKDSWGGELALRILFLLNR